MNKIINTAQKELEELFPKEKITEKELVKLDKELNRVEGNWNANAKKHFEKKLVKYLLICEAPPATGNYFYQNWSDKSDKLVTKVWNVFFSNPKPTNAARVYQCLANEGFLLIDTLPYIMNYSKGNHRFNPQYYSLILKCLPWWLNKLKGFSFAPDLKIAFGYNQNALNVIIALSQFNTTKYPAINGKVLTPKLIAQDSAGNPNTKKLIDIFGIKSKKTCI